MWNGRFQPGPPGSTVEVQRGDVVAVRNFPYDYVATFSLTGEMGRLQEDVINVSVEGVFVAQEIGYGFIAERTHPTLLQQKDDQTPLPAKLADAKLENLAPDVLIAGFRFNPVFQGLAFQGDKLNPQLDSSLVDPATPENERINLLERLIRADDLHFLFQIIDSGSGRELQNLPIHNIAGLGKSNGERPFRMLAKPVAFLPRSTIRIQIQEATIGVNGLLHIALHGYKILGAADVSETKLRAAPTIQRVPALYGSELATSHVLKRIREGRVPRTRLVPFDYVASFDLKGQPQNLIEDEVHINVEGGFVTTAIGYSLVPAEKDIPLNFTEEDPEHLGVSQIRLSHFPVSVLQDGFRIRPNLVNIVFKDGELVSDPLPRETINLLFERLIQPGDVRFKFRIIDGGTGRELQNRLELNIAGLGIANGDRPFRELSYPLHFMPRSTIRVVVEEISGRGRLFIVFQGYKILGIA